MSHFALLVPAPFDTISGGYEYDRRIVAELREAGHQVDVIELAGLHPIPDEAARRSAEAGWAAMAAEAIPVIDGLALPAFASLAGALEARGAVGLIHHPTALETGLSADDAAMLMQAERDLLPRLARIVVTSQVTANRLVADFGVDVARVAVVVPGTEDAPRSLGSGGPTCRILSIGTLVPRKGHDVLLRSLARLFDLDWSLTIVGAPRDPVHAAALQALAEERGIAQRVRFAGEVGGEALEALWREADLFALATHYEGYGMAIAEALKRGLPVAVTSGGAAAALMVPESGVVCEPGDEVTLGKSMRRLIFDTELRQESADTAWKIGQTLPGWAEQARRFAEATSQA